MSELGNDKLSEIIINLVFLSNEVDNLPPALAGQVFDRAIRELKEVYEDYRRSLLVIE